MIDVEMIEEFYTYFYIRKYKENRYKFKRSKTTKSVCESFLKIIDKEYSLHSVTKNFLWEYFLYQFQYWHDLTFEENKFTDKIVIAWIVGKKAFDRWKERDQEYDWQIETFAIVKEYNLEKKELFNRIDFYQPIKVEEVKRYDSSKDIRKKYLNTEVGLVMCTEFTTLFDPADMSCIRCENRKTCKLLLQANYPVLFTKRKVKI